MDITTSTKGMQKRVEIFCCYAHEDRSHLQNLTKHLMPLKREGLVTLWTDTDINAGVEWEKEIRLHLNTSHIILLLVSPDFIASDYCYGIEMTRAMERHANDEAQVIPIILRSIDWLNTPFGKIQALPTDGKPIIGCGWHNIDEAFEDVAHGIRKVVENLRSPQQLARTLYQGEALRSSHVRLIDASLDPHDSPYEQTIEQGKKTIRYVRLMKGGQPGEQQR